MARDHLYEVSWIAGELKCHVSKESEAQQVAAEYLLAQGLIKVRAIDEEEKAEKH